MSANLIADLEAEKILRETRQRLAVNGSDVAYRKIFRAALHVERAIARHFAE